MGKTCQGQERTDGRAVLLKTDIHGRKQPAISTADTAPKQGNSSLSLNTHCAWGKLFLFALLNLQDIPLQNVSLICCAKYFKLVVVVVVFEK